MAKAPRHINGVPLHRAGVPALGDDCCCSPTCYPNACLIDTRAMCCQYYCPEADDCRHINSFEINISGVGAAITCPSSGGSSCCYAFDCECDLFNTTFIHELDSVCGIADPGNGNGCINRWILRSPSFTGIATSDGCNIPATPLCGPWISERVVRIETGFANFQQSYTAGFINGLYFPNAFTTYGQWQICNDYTLVPGHYIVVVMSHVVRQPFFNDGWATEKMFLYSFGNAVKAYTECSDTNYYPVANFTGGNAVLFAGYRYKINGFNRPVTFTYDCNDWDYTCQLADATVSVEAPDYELCEVEPPPPPPP